MAICPERIKDKTTGQMVDKRVDGKIQYCIRTYVIGIDGKRHQTTRHNPEWLGRDGYWLAQQEENRIRKELFKVQKNIKFDELANKYLEQVKNTLKYSTYLKHFHCYESHLKEYFQDKYITKIKVTDILNWKNNINSKDLSLAYKRGIFITLSAILNYGVKYYNLNNNVARIEGNFKRMQNQKKKEMKFITDKQFQQAITFETNLYYFTVYNLLFYSGIRRGEMLALNIDDINFANNTIRINETVNPKISMIPTPPKTNKSNRIIPVDIKLMNLLKKVIDNGVPEDGYIFLHYIKLTTLQRRSNSMLKKIGFLENEYIRIHDYRHSFASFCINNGVEIQELSDYMGHENISVTWNIYSHMYPDSKINLVNHIQNKIIIN